MFNLRNETIKAILTELKIDNNPFNIEVVKEFIVHIADAELKAFYMALFKDGAKIFNGLDRVAKVAEQFKPVGIDLIEERAKELMELAKGMNEAVYQTHIKTGIRFEDLINKVLFPNVKEEDLAILDIVKPYSSHKLLISNINHYQTYKDSLRAFIDAIRYFDKISKTEAIENKTFNALQIRKV